MKLAALFDEHNILVHLDVASYEDAIRALVESVSERLGHLKVGQVVDQLLSVEEELPLPPGHGVRIPHARLSGLNSLVLAMATSPEGIQVRAKSEERAHLIFLILTPKTQMTVMLQTMSSIARLVNLEANRKALVSTTTAARLQRILEESGIQVKKAIVAADLMNPATCRVGPDDSLREATRTLALCGEEGLPVVGEDDELLGDISTRMVIEVGLPKYMNLISDSKVLSEFEPFEAFYKKEDLLKASEVMNAKPLSLAPETPVEILAHEMLTKQCERAYVVADKKLIGVLYRKDIVRKVLNL